MDILDELVASFGPSVLEPSASSTVRYSWHQLCVCGHVDRHHSVSIGGTWADKPPKTIGTGDRAKTRSFSFDGCAGSSTPRGFEHEKPVPNRDGTGVTIVRVPTCPCTEFRPVARVDRPNRYFCQRLPKDRSDRSRHPFLIGIRAFRTHLSKRKAAQVDDGWPAAEFLRRWMWLPGARVCSMSRCKETDDVWPSLVNDEDLSELRCAKHR